MKKDEKIWQIWLGCPIHPISKGIEIKNKTVSKAIGINTDTRRLHWGDTCETSSRGRGACMRIRVIHTHILK